MIPAIDAHVHLWDPARVALPWLRPEHAPIARPFGPEELEPLLAPAGVERVVLVQTAASDADTDLLLELGAAHDWIAALVVWVPFLEPETAAGRLDALAGGKVRGVRHQIHDEADPHWILQPAVLESLRLLEERGLVLELSAEWPRHLGDVPELARSFPDLTIVVDHLAKPPFDLELDAWARELELAAAHANVAAKISGLNTATARADWDHTTLAPAVQVAFDAFGADRLMCGSDWPVALLNGDYTRVWRETRAAVRDDPQVLAATAARLYRLPEALDGAH
jgi:L-fuconolactonase